MSEPLADPTIDRLTPAQLSALRRLDHRVYSLTELHHATREALYRRCILAKVYAGGHSFFEWTEFGNFLRERLLARDPHHDQ